MRTIASLLLVVCVNQFALADDMKSSLPYDESADARVDLATAYAKAEKENKLVMVCFGANWCPDCRAFDKAIKEPALARSIAEQYVVVKVDVGNWDKNPQVIERFGNPIAGGIPSIVVTDSKESMIFATKGGQLASARSMDQAKFTRFFNEVAKLAK